MADALTVLSRLPSLFRYEPNLLRRAAHAQIILLLCASEQCCRLVIDGIAKGKS